MIVVNQSNEDVTYAAKEGGRPTVPDIVDEHANSPPQCQPTFCAGRLNGPGQHPLNGIKKSGSWTVKVVKTGTKQPIDTCTGLPWNAVVVIKEDLSMNC